MSFGLVLPASNSSLMLSSFNFSERAEDFFETFVILSAILLPIKSPVASVFLK